MPTSSALPGAGPDDNRNRASPQPVCGGMSACRRRLWSVGCARFPADNTDRHCCGAHWHEQLRVALFSIPATFLTGAAAAGGIALINSVGNLGGFVGPYTVGWLKDSTGSFKAGMFGLALMLVAAGLSALLLKLVRKA